jgi:tetratricopeptide (TPR) repeat protein
VIFETKQALDRALGLHRAGRLNEAEGLYRQILAREPNHAESLHLLGVIAHQGGHNEVAIDLIGKAIACNDGVADFHCNIGAALEALGRLPEAEAHYKRAINLNPNHAETHNNFGNALMRQGKLDEAQAEFRRALGLRTGYVEAYYNLGNALMAQGRTDEAIRPYHQAVGLKPAFPRAHYNLGDALAAQGRLAEAAESYRQAVALKPAWAEAHRKLGAMLRKLDRLSDAELCFRRAHEVDPRASDGLEEWAEILGLLSRNNEAAVVCQRLCELAPWIAKRWFELGLALQKAKKWTDAVAAYLRAREIDPEYPYLRNNLAAAYLDLGQAREAIEMLQDLIDVGRADGLAFINLALAYNKAFEPAHSVAISERAIAADPSNPHAYSNCGRTLMELQRWDDAGAMFERALAIDPHRVDARWNLAMLQLLRGDYARGWVNHETRWEGSGELQGAPRGGLPQPLWQGEPLAGKTLFVWGEQGLGDALQFARYVPIIAERVKREGGRMLYCCFGPLLRLFRRSFAECAEAIFPDDFQPMPAFDYHCPLLSLPLRLGTTLETLPGRMPYLVVDEQKVAAWRERLAAEGRLKVALVWSGSATHQRNPFRAVGLKAYATAFRQLHNVAFYSLQFDARQEIHEARASGFDIMDHTPELRDFDDSAAFLRNMDLLVTVCTSTAHLAGAIAARAWLLLDVNPHWVWLIDRSDSPWYPTLTLFRQNAYRQWAPVMARVQAELAAVAQRNQPD